MPGIADQTEGKTHVGRLRLDLNRTHEELIQTLGLLTPDALNWSPRPDAGMRTFKQILQEIATMETLTLHMAAYRKELDWSVVWKSLEKNDMESLIAALNDVRAETLAFLDQSDDAALRTEIPLSPEWQGYLHAPVVEVEVLLQWILMHEYYHLGQVIVYQRQRGALPAAPPAG